MSLDSAWGVFETAAYVLMKAEAVESLREIRISECVGTETFTVYSPAASCVLPATKSKGILITKDCCAWATRVVANMVSAITPAITKALVFMGLSFSCSLKASWVTCLSPGSLGCSAPQHGVHFRVFPREGQCTRGELRVDYG